MRRLPLPAAYLDPAFIRCLYETAGVPDLIKQFDRLAGTSLAERPSPVDAMVDAATGKANDDMRKFVEFVHDLIYLRLPDKAIQSLREPSAGAGCGCSGCHCDKSDGARKPSESDVFILNYLRPR